MALEFLYIDSFIRARLSGDSTFTTALGGAKIHRQREPQGSVHPVCIYRLIDSEDINSGNKQVRLIARATYELTIKSKGLATTGAVTAANRMDELFRNVRRVSYTAGGVTLSFNSWREVMRPTYEQGAEPHEFFVTNGGLYTFEAFTAE